MSHFTFWILYHRNDEKNVLVIKTKTDDSLTYSQVCDLYKLKPKDYSYECVTDVGFEVLFRSFYEFSHENLKSKNIYMN